MRFTTRGGPCAGRTYDFASPLPPAIALPLPDNRRARYVLTWRKVGPRNVDTAPTYVYERTE